MGTMNKRDAGAAENQGGVLETTRRRVLQSPVLSAAILGAMALGTPALGQSAAAETDPPADASEPGDIEIVTVYGTSNPLPAFDYPGQVSIIGRDQIETFAPSAISDTLRDVPGLDFIGGPRRTGESPTLRGLSRENVLILLDGARQSFTSAHDGEFFLDPELLRSAEVVRGTASALYGSGALGGVLAFETVDAADLLREGESAGVRLRVGYQDVNEEALISLTGFGRTDRLDGLVNIAMRDSGDIALGDGTDLPSDDDILNALVKGTVSLTEALTIEGSWQRFANEAFEPNNGQGTLGTGDSTLDRNVEKDITTDTFRIAGAFRPLEQDWIDANITLYRTDTEVEEFDPTLPRTTVRDIQTTGVTARNATRFNLGAAENTFTIGLDWYEDEQEGTDDNSVDGARQGVPNGEAEFLGVFAQLETSIQRPLGLPGELLLIPGVRFDSFENSATAPDENGMVSDFENSDEEVSPRFGASYAPQEWLRVFGSYSQGFRAPSINELFLTGPHFPLPHPVLFDPTGFPPSFVFVNNNFVPNPDLKPETAESIEIGAGVDFDDVFSSGDSLTAKLSYYETEVEDLINLFVDIRFPQTCFIPTPPFNNFPCDAGVTTSENLDSAELSGVEFEGVYDADRFRLSVAYASVDGEDAETGSDLGTLTPDRLNLDGRVKFPRQNASLGARVQLADELELRRFDDDVDAFVVFDQRDSYAVLDLYATWEPAFANGLRVDLGVDNVFDEDYERVFQGVSEPGINPRIAVSYQLGFGG